MRNKIINRFLNKEKRKTKLSADVFLISAVLDKTIRKVKKKMEKLNSDILIFANQ